MDAFLQLEGLPRHTQLIDGSLVFVSPQEKWHRRLISLLRWALDQQALQASSGLRADREMMVRLGDRQGPEPDVILVTAEAYDRPEPSTYYFADDVLLAVEVVSPESVDRDRDTKPRRYSAAGIQHFWRVEPEDDRAVVYVYQRDLESKGYALTGIHHDRLKLTVPFDLDIDLTTAGKPIV